MRRPAGLASLASHSGGDGAPPGPITRPCQELADDLSIALPPFGLLERNGGAPGASRFVGRGAVAFLLRYRPPAYLSTMAGSTQAKAGPVRSHSRRMWRAERRPPCPATDTDAIGLRFSARHSLPHFVGSVTS